MRMQHFSQDVQKTTLFTDCQPPIRSVFLNTVISQSASFLDTVDSDACEGVGPRGSHCFHVQRTCRSVHPPGSKGKRQGAGPDEDVGAGGGTVPSTPDHPPPRRRYPHYPTTGYHPARRSPCRTHPCPWSAPAVQPSNASTTATFLIP